MIRVPNENSPKKLANIPESAIWSGGVDEGFWFELVELYQDHKKVRIRIYNDYDGNMVLDADFTPISDCKIKDESELLNKINYFEFKKIILLDGCELDAIYPAYGGAFWEIDKEMNE